MFASGGEAQYPMTTLFRSLTTFAGQATASLFTLACLLHLSLPSVLLLAPVILLNITRPVSRLALPRPFDADLKRALPLLGEFIGYSVLLTIASTMVCGNLSWIENTWGAS